MLIVLEAILLAVQPCVVPLCSLSARVTSTRLATWSARAATGTTGPRSPTRRPTPTACTSARAPLTRRTATTGTTVYPYVV